MNGRRWRSVMWGLAVIAIVVAGITLGPGWSGIFTGSELAVVEADPMANLDLPGVEELSRRHENAGTTLGKPSPAQVVVRYRIVDDPAAVLEAAVVVAEATGWVGGYLESDYYRAKRAVDEGTLELIVSISDQRPEPGLFVRVILQR